MPRDGDIGEKLLLVGLDGRGEGEAVGMLEDLLRKLADNRSGLDVVYDALDRVVAQASAVDALLVLENPLIGRQCFRAGRKPVGEEEYGHPVHELPPGLYTTPPEASSTVEAPLLSLLELAVTLDRTLHDARHDPLTGLPNRREFENVLARSCFQAARYGWPFALVLMDLDGFKKINDTLGHQKGDEILKELGRRLRSTLRGGDLAARIGGDEFAIILANASATGARKVSRRLEEDLSGHHPSLSASFGFASAPADGTEPRTLFAIADGRLYQDKVSRG
jgi:diguanylate cyclase (GGDEF)-like protein